MRTRLRSVRRGLLWRVTGVMLVCATVMPADAVASAPDPEHFWSWWHGGMVLGAITVAFWIVLHLPLGVSNSWDKLSVWRRERARERQEAVVQNADPNQIRDALMAETLAQFGSEAVAKLPSVPATGPQPAPPQPRLPVTAHLVFLVMIGIGGGLSALLNNGFGVRFDLGPVHRAFFGDGVALWIALFAGGALAGFGTRLAGGCTSGHGLSGMSCLQLGSLIATLSFFTTAIVVSLAIELFL